MKTVDGTSEKLLPAGHYLLQLVRGALTEDRPEEKPEDLLWEDVLLIARRNSLSPLAYYGVLKLQKQPDPLLKRAWRDDLMHNVIRMTQMDNDRKRLAKMMDGHGIDYLFIKGIFIQSLYPKPGMRQMSDNDILYRLHGNPDPQQGGASQMAMIKMLEESDFRIISTKGIVDVCCTGESSLFEMHREFLGPDQELYSYFENIWDRAERQSGCGEYRISQEDHYILMLAHSYKHFTGGGCGPREIIDAWVYRNTLGSQMDWMYIENQLQRMGLADYEKMVGNLGQIIFADQKGSSKDWMILDYFLGCGTYGNKENSVRNSLAKISKNGKNEKRAKMIYLWKRLFPEPDFLKTQYPFFYKHRSLILILLIYRAVQGLRNRKEDILEEIHILKNLKQKEQMQIKE